MTEFLINFESFKFMKITKFRKKFISDSLILLQGPKNHGSYEAIRSSFEYHFCHFLAKILFRVDFDLFWSFEVKNALNFTFIQISISTFFEKEMCGSEAYPPTLDCLNSRLIS